MPITLQHCLRATRSPRVMQGGPQRMPRSDSIATRRRVAKSVRFAHRPFSAFRQMQSTLAWRPCLHHTPSRRCNPRRCQSREGQDARVVDRWGFNDSCTGRSPQRRKLTHHMNPTPNQRRQDHFSPIVALAWEQYGLCAMDIRISLAVAGSTLAGHRSSVHRSIQ